MDEENTISFLDAGTIMFFIMALVLDASFIFLIGLFIPVIGMAIAVFVLGAHYFIGLFILAFFFKKSQGFLAKAILVVSWILPLPLLTLGLILMVIASNKVGAFIVEQVAIQAVAVATAGAGEALEGAALAGEAAEGAATAAQAAEGAATAAEGATTVAAEGAEAAGGAAEAGTAGAEGAGEAAEGGAAGERTPGDEFSSPEERNPMENLQEDLNEPAEDRFGQEASGEEPEPEEEDDKDSRKNKAVERTKKVFDILDRGSQQQSRRGGDDAEGLDEAA